MHHATVPTRAQITTRLDQTAAALTALREKPYLSVADVEAGWSLLDAIHDELAAVIVWRHAPRHTGAAVAGDQASDQSALERPKPPATHPANEQAGEQEGSRGQVLARRVAAL